MEKSVNTKNSSKNKQFLSFTLGNEIYGLDIMVAESIERVSNITSVPKTPDFVLGVTNIRGDIIPVISLRQRLGIWDREGYHEDTRIVITRLEDYRVGMIVDRVNDILSIPETNIQASKDLLKKERNTFFSTVIKYQEDYILVLDLAKVLDIGEII